jgi:outer membrane protein assembly factor BamB
MKRTRLRPRVTLYVTLLLITPALADASWPQFRGPNASGIAKEPDLPDTWSTTKNILWKTPVPGSGWSSPIISRGKVFVTAVVSKGKTEKAKKGLYFGGERFKPVADLHHWIVYCLDLKTGKMTWKTTAHTGKPAFSKHIKNTYASETAVTDGQRVYAYFGNVGVFCYDFGGKLIWSRTCEPVKTKASWGTAASPVLHEGRLYIVNDNEDQSYLLALDARTGKQVWRVDRDERSNWSTPLIWTNSLRSEIVTPGTGKVRSYDLNGKLLWELAGMSKITIPTPQAKSGLLYVSSGFVLDSTRPIYAIRPGASGDISLEKDQTSNAHIAWCDWKAAPYNPSPLVYGDYIYVLHDRGFFACYDAKTGRPAYKKRRIRRGAGAFTASPFAYDGKVFCLSEDGDTFVIKAGPEYKLLHTNSLDEMCMATPAIVNGSLIIRSASHLYRIGNEPGTKRK